MCIGPTTVITCDTCAYWRMDNIKVLRKLRARNEALVNIKLERMCKLECAWGNLQKSRKKKKLSG
jgi:hypothetical protein